MDGIGRLGELKRRSFFGHEQEDEDEDGCGCVQVHLTKT